VKKGERGATKEPGDDQAFRSVTVCYLGGSAPIEASISALYGAPIMCTWA
jgi:hypothetical protein